MKRNYIKCINCGKTFSYVVFEMRVPGGSCREEIYCPYCRKENGSIRTSGWIESYKDDDFFNNIKKLNKC